MPVQYAFGSVTKEFDQYLQGVTAKPKHALWLRPVAREFDRDDLRELLGAFSPLRGIAWSGISSLRGGNKTEEVAWAERWGKLTEGTVSETSWTLQPRNRVATCRVAWLGDNACESLPYFLGHAFGLLSISPGNCALSFLPHDEQSAVDWAKVAQGPFWLWLCEEWLDNSPDPSLRSESVVVSYIDLTNEIGGVPGLVWWDGHAKTGLTFFGPEETLCPIVERLEHSRSFVHDDTEFDRLLTRGFSYVMT